MSRLLTIAVTTASLLFATTAQAHLRWLLPSHTVLSDAAAVTFDASVSNDVFHVARPYPLTGLTVLDPEGRAATAHNLLNGARRNVFDVEIDKPGTWQVMLENTGYFLGYVDRNGERQRWRGDRKALDKALRKARREAEGPVAVTESHSRLGAFVTLGAPSAIAPREKGLDIRFDTHPNDLYAGETLTLTVTFDGAPAAGVELSLVAGGTRYRDTHGEQVFTTDEQGRVSITWPYAGLYLLVAEHESDSGIEDVRRRDALLLTLEVLPL